MAAPFKIKIVEPGWETYTGDLGPNTFENGVSVNEVTPIEAARLANLIRVETLEGHNPSTSQLVLESRSTPMGQETEVPVDRSAVVPLGLHLYSEAELQVIADAEGITGLRKVSEPLGVKGTSITKLISAVLAAQGVAEGKVSVTEPEVAEIITAAPTVEEAVAPVAEEEETAVPVEEKAAE